MKTKSLIIAAVSLMLAGTLYAGETFTVPSADAVQQADINYGGVNYATSVFTAEYATAALDASTLYGVLFSSGASSEFVDVWDSTSAERVSTLKLATQRLYNVNATTAASSALAGSGFSGPKYPVRMKRGILFKPSVATFNSIILYFWKQD